MLLLVSAAVLLGMSEWFTASAAGPDLQIRWELSMTQVGWLTTVVQLGFVAGTAVAALLNLADVFPSRAYFAVSALAAAAANAALLVVPGFAVALAARFATGFFLAGVYPPGMKMIATWFRSARGFAIGTVVGALTVGKATPYLLKAAGGPGVTSVILGASLAGCLASVLVLTAYRDGPYPFGRRPFSWAQVLDVFGDRRTMLATGGYLGHMWELYAMWATVSVYFTDFFATPAGGSTVGGFHAAELVAFGVIASGGAGAVVAGAWADRWGRERTTMWMMALSGSCAVMMGWVLPLSAWVVVPLALAWGFTIVADSAQFSACVTEVAPRHAIGTALTLQTSLGFALSAVSVQSTVWLAEVGGWRLAYGVLAVGPVLGILAMGRLRAERHVKPVG
ncbi:MAG: MFS transporter [Gemmatimonadota bacterium]